MAVGSVFANYGIFVSRAVSGVAAGLCLKPWFPEVRLPGLPRTIWLPACLATVVAVSMDVRSVTVAVS